MPSSGSAWALRSAFVLLYWAERLEAVVCTTDQSLSTALRLALAGSCEAASTAVGEQAEIDTADRLRRACIGDLAACWRRARRFMRGRSAAKLTGLACDLTRTARRLEAPHARFELLLGPREVPDPAFLIRRVLNGEDPWRDPPLPPKVLQRRPLCLLPSFSSGETGLD